MARRRLKFPMSIAFAVVSAGAATVSCGSNSSPSPPDGSPPPPVDASPDAAETDAPVLMADGPVIDATIDTGPAADAHSALFCVPDGTGTGDAGGCPVFADQNNECPPGCEPVS